MKLILLNHCELNELGEKMELKKINCPICSCKEYEVIGKTRKIDEIFKSTQYMEISSCNVVQCKKCSLLYVNPFPFFSDDLLSRMYSTGNNYFQQLTSKMDESFIMIIQNEVLKLLKNIPHDPLKII
jgi:hypothetical protein